MTCYTAKNRSAYGRENGFSLLEILTVLAVMMVLLGLAVPSLQGVGKAEALGLAGNKVANLLSLARQNSMSKNVMTAFVMLTDSSLGQSNSRTFALYEFDPPTDGSAPSSSNWKQLTKWETVPTGVVVDQWVWNNSASPQPPPTLPVQEMLPPLNFSGTSTSAYQSVIFLPRGNLFESTSSPLSIRLSPGVIPPGQSTVQYTTAMSGGNPANYYDITVMSYTGQVRIARP